MKLSITVTDDDVTQAQSPVQVPAQQADGITPQAADGGAAPTWLVELLGQQGTMFESIDAGAPKV